MTLHRIPIESLLSGGAGAGDLAERLRAGAVAGIPTETFYGLAANPLSERGVLRVLEVKGRGRGKPLLVLFASREQLSSLGVSARPAIMAPFFSIWPAPLTVVLPLRMPIPASCGESRLAVRMPAHEKLRALLSRIGPVTGTSLNRSGQPPCEDAECAERLFGGEIDVLVDGGRAPGGDPSTLIDGTVEPPRVLRKGAFPWPPERS